MSLVFLTCRVLRSRWALVVDDESRLSFTLFHLPVTEPFVCDFIVVCPQPLIDLSFSTSFTSKSFTDLF